VGVATVIVTGLMVTAGLTAGMVSANRRERLADASAACERSARAWSAGSAAWGRDRDRIMGSVDLDALRATDPDMAGSLERLSSDPATPAGCTAGGDAATLDADAKRISKAADRLAKRSERLEKAVAKAGQTVGDAESSRSRSRLERAVADARGLLAGSTADQYKVPYLYRRLEQLTEQAAGLLDYGSASPADMDRLFQGIDSMVASLASGTR